jgi:flavodoxin
MMRALVVFESMFGNTEPIAWAVLRGMERHGDVEMVEVSNAPDEIDDSIDLLVVGAPTLNTAISSL